MAARQQTVQVEGALKAREREVSEVALLRLSGGEVCPKAHVVYS